MPEGDSVYRLARRLDAALAGRRIAHAELRVAAHASAQLGGTTVLEHGTHGKHLLTRFDDGRTLHTHLRMQGSWTTTRPGRRLPPRVWPHVRVLLRTGDGATTHGISLPVVQLIRTADERIALAHLGPDPLRADWDPELALARLAARPDRPLVAALLDQRVIAGLGNLWANELCFLSGVWPWRPAGAVALAPLIELAAAMLTRSAQVPNSYQVTTGDPAPGRQHWVAGRAGRTCRRCATTIRVVAEVAHDPEQRRTWWCPRCQPGPELVGGRRP